MPFSDADRSLRDIIDAVGMIEDFVSGMDLDGDERRISFGSQNLYLQVFGSIDRGETCLSSRRAREYMQLTRIETAERHRASDRVGRRPNAPNTRSMRRRLLHKLPDLTCLVNRPAIARLRLSDAPPIWVQMCRPRHF